MNEPTRIPSKWVRATVGELVHKVSLKASPLDLPYAKFVGMDSIEPNKLRPSTIYQFKDFKTAGNLFEVDQVLYGRMRPYLNKVFKADFNGVCSGEFIVLQCYSDFSPAFLQYVLHAQTFVTWVGTKTSGDRPRVTFEEISQYPILLPPSNEQERIVVKIEELFSELDAGADSFAKARAQLKSYRQSVLEHAFQGRLTNDNITEGELPEGWFISTVDDVAEVGTGVTPLKSNSSFYQGGTIPWVTSGALNREFVSEPSGYVTETALEETNLRLYPKHTLLVALYGEGKTRGKCSELLIEACTNQAIAAINLRDENESLRKYLKLFLLKNYNDIRRESSGGVQPNLNLGIVKRTEFPLCSVEEQRRIVAEIESRLSVCDKLEEEIETGLKRSDALRQSILEKAFSGRLVEQDHRDEPAAVLLERIRAEREALSKTATKPIRQVREKRSIERMVETVKTILELLEDSNGNPMATHYVWQSSNHKDDIDAFYAEVKELIDLKKIKEGKREGRESFLVLAKSR